MKKFLGVGFVFSAIDKGLNKYFDNLNNDAQKFNDELDETADKKPKNGSVLDAISEIAKLGLLKNISNGVAELGGKIQDVNRGFSGQGLSEEYKTVEGLTRRLTVQFGDANKAAQLVDQTVSSIVRGTKVTTETAATIAGAFIKNNLQVDKFASSLDTAAKFTKTFDLDAGEVSNSFALGLKTLGFTEKGLKDITSQVTLLEGKTGLSGIAGNLPNVLKLVQKQVQDGILPAAAAKDQVQRINNLVTAFRNTGVEIGDAQGFVEGLTSNIKGVTEAFAKIKTGVDSGELSQLATSFGRLGIDIGSVQKAFASGNIDAAFGQILKAGSKARSVGGADLQAFNMLIKDAFGEDAMAVITAASTKAFGEVQGAIKGVDKALRDGSAAKEAEKVFQSLTNTVEDQETQIKGLEQEFSRGISNSIAPAVKEYNTFRIKSLESMADATKGTDDFVLGSIVALKKFQQGGLLPFTDSITKFTGISEEALFKFNAAASSFIPVIKDGADDIFFFTGALANLAKLSPSPTDLFNSMSGGAISATKNIFKFGKQLISAGSIGQAFTVVMTAVKTGIAAIGGPITLVVAGVAALSAGFYVAYQRSETFRGIVDETWASVTKLADIVWTFAKEYLPVVWSGIKTTIDFFVKWMTPIGLVSTAINKLGEIFPSVFGKLKETAKPVMEFFTNFTSSIGKTIDRLTELAKSSTIGKIAGEIFGKKSEAKATVAVAAPTAPTTPTPPGSALATQPTTVATPDKQTARLEQQKQQAIMDAQGATNGQVPFAPTPVQDMKKFQDAQKNIADPSIKQLAIVFAEVGNQIINAILQGQQSVNVELKGDSRSLFKASTSAQNNRAVGRGITG